MTRGLLLLLALLVAALPVGLCVCGHDHDQPAEKQDECHCQDSPRVATPTAPTDLTTDSPAPLPFVSADLSPSRPPVSRPVFRSESPPGFTSVPLYLSVGRLTI